MVRFAVDIIDFQAVNRHVTGYLASRYASLIPFISGPIWGVTYLGDNVQFGVFDDLATVSAGINSLPSIIAAGGVTVALEALGISNVVTFNNTGVRSLFVLEIYPSITYQLRVLHSTIGDATTKDIQLLRTAYYQPTLAITSVFSMPIGFHWEIATDNVPYPYGTLASNPYDVYNYLSTGLWGENSPANVLSMCWFDFGLGVGGGATFVEYFPIPGYLNNLETGDYYIFLGCVNPRRSLGAIPDSVGPGTDAPPLHVHWDDSTDRGIWSLIP